MIRETTAHILTGKQDMVNILLANMDTRAREGRRKHPAYCIVWQTRNHLDIIYFLSKCALIVLIKLKYLFLIFNLASRQIR